MTASAADLCRQQHGFHVGPGPGGALFVYLAAGTDGSGAPLTWAREASPDEIEMWEAGRYMELASMVRVQQPPALPRSAQPTGAAPAQPASVWRRFLSGLRRVVGFGR